MVKSNSISITVAAGASVLSATITQTCGVAPVWNISGGTPSGGFTVQAFVSGSLVANYSYTFSSSGTDSRSFYGGFVNVKGKSLYIVVTDTTTGKMATSNTLTVC